MQAVEFYAEVKDGMIAVPERHLKKLGSNVRIVMFSDKFEKLVASDEDKSVDSLMGSLNHYADPGLIPLEKGAWGRVAEKKHAID
ncbi:MAG: hypothetical protein FWD03_07600 [Defluviitaleaceae bacterium]|nr:hypothetical protein [Defluviitaleaceae bacterium]